jgi:trimeric autotransporter adhesin
MRKQLTIFMFLFLAIMGYSQAPQKMSYQAVVRNASNALVTNTAVSTKISILQSSATGSVVYAETHTITTNSNGLLSLELGAGSVISGTFSAINWGNGPYFIKNETDVNGGSNYNISSTSQFLSVPYALYSESSGGGWNLNGNTGTDEATNFIGTTDNKSIVFKRNNIIAGRLDETSTSFGLYSSPQSSLALWNTTYGVFASATNTYGAHGTAIGYASQKYYSGPANLWYNYNVSVGYQSLQGVLTASANTGNGNTAVGFKSLRTNSIGYDNVAVGNNALLSNTSGSFNVAVGSEALNNCATVSRNIAIGYSALTTNSVGSNNTAVGHEAMYSNTSGKFNSAFGDGALYYNTTGDYNCAIGRNAMYNCISSSYNTALGFGALLTGITGSNNIGIGYNAAVPINSNSNQVRIGNNSITYAGVQVAWSVTSDKRWKTNIVNSPLGLAFINDLRPVAYTRVNDTEPKMEYGIIAQELETALLKHGANENGIITKDDEGYYSVRYNDLIAPMIKAIQEQNEIITKLEKRIKELESSKK